MSATTQTADQPPVYLSEVSVVAPKPIRPMPSTSALETVEPPLERVPSNSLSMKPDELQQNLFQSFLRLCNLERPAILRRRVSTGRIRRWGMGMRDTKKIAYEDTSLIRRDVAAPT